MYKRSSQGWIKHMDFILWDVFAQQLAFNLCYCLYNRTGALVYSDPDYRSLGILLALLDVAVAVLFNTMHGVLKRGYYQEAAQTLRQVALVFVGITLFLFTMKLGSVYSRVILSTTALTHFLFSYLFRLLWKRHLNRTADQHIKNSMILVAPEDAVGVVLGSQASADETRVVGVVLTDRDAEGETVAGLPVVANLDNAARYICREWVDEVFFCPDSLSVGKNAAAGIPPSVDSILYDSFPDYARKARQTTQEAETEAADGPTAEQNGVSRLIEQCGQMAIPVHILLPVGAMGGKSFVEKVYGFDVLTHAANTASPLQLLLKRGADLAGGLVGSLAAVLIILIVGPLIKIASPGPILFRQERIGLNGKHFRMLKLRSMDVDAEERKAGLQDQNSVSDGRMFKMEFDPRVIGNRILPDGTKKTGIGEFIRRTSLDEFPQFFNVLKGDMSLVGTRPPTLDEWERYELHHRARLSVRPGITGLWQVSGRSEITDFEEVVRLDTQYINNWSIGLDIRILLKTVKIVLCGRGAM